MLGFAWHPETKEMWGIDHGVDHLGDELPGEELNKIEQGSHYGYPFCYGDRKPDWASFTEPPGMPKDEFCPEQDGRPGTHFSMRTHRQSVLSFTMPSSFPLNIATMLSSRSVVRANRRDPKGYKVVRVNFEDGKPKDAEDFLTGFLAEEGKSQFGRPAGLAIAKDGALLVSEDTNGVIYRISHK